jgi:hypothetical protein
LVTKVNKDFWNQNNILNFFYLIWPISRKKFFHLSEGPFFKFSDTKNDSRKKQLKMKQNAFSKMFSDIFSSSKTAARYVKFLNRCTLLRSWNQNRSEPYSFGVCGTWTVFGIRSVYNEMKRKTFHTSLYVPFFQQQKNIMRAHWVSKDAEFYV